MKQDKALLAHPEGGTLLDRQMRLLSRIASPVTLLSGSANRYPGRPSLDDARPGCGPLGGIVAALRHLSADAALILAVDMPLVSMRDLDLLTAAFDASGGRVVIAADESGLHPGLAIWPAPLRFQLEADLAGERFRMRDLLADLGPRSVTLPSRSLANWNSVADMASKPLAIRDVCAP